MTRHDIDFITLHFSPEHRTGLALDNAGAQLARHLLHIILVQVQFLGDLLIRKVESHQIQTQHPGPQRLMVAREDGPRQIIKVAATTPTLVALALGLRLIASASGHLRGVTMRATDALWPAHLAHCFVALNIIHQIV